MGLLRSIPNSLRLWLLHPKSFLVPCAEHLLLYLVTGALELALAIVFLVLTPTLALYLADTFGLEIGVATVIMWIATDEVLALSILTIMNALILGGMAEVQVGAVKGEYHGFFAVIKAGRGKRLTHFIISIANTMLVAAVASLILVPMMFLTIRFEFIWYIFAYFAYPVFMYFYGFCVPLTFMPYVIVAQENVGPFTAISKAYKTFFKDWQSFILLGASMKVVSFCCAFIPLAGTALVCLGHPYFMTMFHLYYHEKNGTLYLDERLRPIKSKKRKAPSATAA